MARAFTWTQVPSMVIAVIALVVSCWSLKQSHDANDISNEALIHAKSVAVEEQRPRLQLKPATKNGIALQCVPKGDRLHFVAHINMKNTGKTPAINITSLKDSIRLIIPGLEFDAKDLDASKVPKSLSPGQDFYLIRGVSASPHDPKMVESIIAHWAEGRVYLLTDISLKYTDVSSEHEYSVSGSYKLNKRAGFIVNYRDE